MAEEALMVEVGGSCFLAQAVLGVDQPEHRHVVVRVPAPLVGTKMANEGGQEVGAGWLVVVAGARRRARAGGPAIWDCRPAHRAEPTGPQQEQLGQGRLEQ